MPEDNRLTPKAVLPGELEDLEDLGLPTNAEALAKPEGLTDLGEQAWKVITSVAAEARLNYTGGCKAFYSPAEWTARGETYGCDSLLIVVYDGGDLRCFFEGEPQQYEDMREALADVGVYTEACTCWYSAVYPI